MESWGAQPEVMVLVINRVSKRDVRRFIRLMLRDGFPRIRRNMVFKRDAVPSLE